jgi:hypothetical protein
MKVSGVVEKGFKKHKQDEGINMSEICHYYFFLLAAGCILKLLFKMKRINKKSADDNRSPCTPELTNFSSDTCTLLKKNSAINGCYRDYIFKPNSTCITAAQIFDQCNPGIEAVLQQCIDEDAPIKAWFTIVVLFYKISILDGQVDNEDSSYMSTCATRIQLKEDIANLASDSLIEFDEQIETYTNKGSNWVVGEIRQLILKLVSVKP